MRKIITVFFAIVFLFGCDAEDPDSPEIRNEPQAERVVNPDVVKGVVRVKFSRETGESLSITRSSGQMRCGRIEVDSYLRRIGAKEMKRVFPYAGEYENRTRREGLHLWYDIFFDESQPLTKAVADAREISGVDIVEEVYRPVIPACNVIAVPLAISPKGKGNEEFFGDPGLERQWHYHNAGNIKDSKIGADINLMEAWKVETGKSNVIVAVVDSGIDFEHEDLKDNMWVNAAEQKGTAGVDDDNNGYVDDVYGYNFVTGSGKIKPEDHGTHVSGTIGACNNNEIGVCGIAGGNGTPGSGVRLMNCQIFLDKQSYGIAEAIKYAADNGAVICQNSWIFEGVAHLPSYVKSVIDYFIKYAGCDGSGNQLPDSPMKGGVVFFAAGNENKDYEVYPSAYSEVISVSAMAPDYKKTYYTNRGAWISIMAPGGDERYDYPKGMVFSCLTGNQYGYMQGTSMACPHVSGIAALVVSKYGGPGFTNENLKTRIMGGIRSENIDKLNPGYEGRLGKGYVDAAKTLVVNHNKIPEKVESVFVKEDFTSLELTWKAVVDEDDGTADIYRISLKTEGSPNVRDMEVAGRVYKPGESVVYTLKGLPLNTRFEIMITAVDRWGFESSPYGFTAKTKENHPPKLLRTGNEIIRITETESVRIKLSVEEPDAQSWTYTLGGETRGVVVEKTDDALFLIFKAEAPVGQYTVNVRVSDIFKASADMVIPFEIYRNRPPRQIKEFEPLFIVLGNTGYILDLAEYFVEEDGHDMNFAALALDPSIADVNLEGSFLHLKPKNTGSTAIRVDAFDKFGAKISRDIRTITVREGPVYIVYPIPATKVLHIRFGNEVAYASATVYSSIGRRILERSFTVVDGKRTVDLDVSGLVAGSYMLRVEANNEVFKKSFVKY